MRKRGDGDSELRRTSSERTGLRSASPRIVCRPGLDLTCNLVADKLRSLLATCEVES